MNSLNVDPKDCLDIILTDIQLHSQKVRKPNSFGRQVAKVVHAKKKRGRAFSNNLKVDNKGGISSFDIGMQEYLFKLARQKGKKYVRILTPKEGLNVYLGQDAIERISALQKRVLQKFSKGVYTKNS